MKTHRRLWPLVVVALLIGACASGASSPVPPGVAGTGVAITANAGPTCPVERVPPDPACAPRPVSATVDIIDARGQPVATVQTDAAGTVSVALAPGDYVVQGHPVDGLMGTAAPVNVTVVDGALAEVVLSYDTGIR